MFFFERLDSEHSISAAMVYILGFYKLLQHYKYPCLIYKLYHLNPLIYA